MNQVYVCPICKNDIINENSTYHCDICNKYYTLHDNYIDFIPESVFYAGEVPKADMHNLLDNIPHILHF